LISNNTPALRRSQLEYVAMLANVNIHIYSQSSRELGTAVGKPFNVSVMTVIDAGDADLSAFN
ncbi:ribosomal protein L30e, partial [Kipferlia bialata]